MKKRLLKIKVLGKIFLLFFPYEDETVTEAVAHAYTLKFSLNYRLIST
jgi:hypothetical protein